MSDEPKVTIGVVVQRVSRHGWERLEVRAMARDGDADYPRGVCGGTWSRFSGVPCVDGLQLAGSVSQYSDDRPASFWLSAPEYREVFSIELEQAKAMADVLTRIARHRERDQAYDPGDYFLSFARAIGAKWVCFEARRQPDNRGSTWSGTRWVWYGLTDGRNEYRARIAQWLSEVDEAAAAKRKPVEPAPADLAWHAPSSGDPTSSAEVIAMADRLVKASGHTTDDATLIVTELNKQAS